MGFIHRKGNKLHAKKVEVDGIMFDSKREATRYKYLRDMENDGFIYDLQLQVKFELIPPTYIERMKEYKTKPPKMMKILDRRHMGVSYIADFVYRKGTRTIVEDVKSGREVRKDVFNLKRQLMWGLKGIDVHEVYEDNLFDL